MREKLIVVVDTKLLAYSEFHGKRHILNVFNTLEKLLISKRLLTPNLVFAADVGYSKFRKNILPSYKQNRSDARNKMTETEQNRYKQFNKDYKKLIKFMEHFGKVIAIDGVEADDIASLVVDKFSKTHQIVLITQDKDWCQLLVHEKVRILDPSLREFMDRYNLTKTGLQAEHIVPYKVFTGDSGDNITGLFRFGEVTFRKCLELANSRDLESLKEVVPKVVKKIVLPEGVQNLDELVERNEKLVRLLSWEDLEEEERAKFLECWNKPRLEVSVDDLIEQMLEEFNTIACDITSLDFLHSLSKV